MKTLFKISAMVMILCAVAACGKKDSFTVSGSVKGLGTQNINVIYVTEDAVATESVTAVDSVFSFTGHSKGPAVVELYTNASVLIGRFIACDGDGIEVAFSLQDPSISSVKGNKDAEKLSEFVAANYRSGSMNDAIDRFVTENPESFVSVALMEYYYDLSDDGERAIELIDMIDNKHDWLLRDRRQMLAAAAAPRMPIGTLTLIAPADTVMDITPEHKGVTLYWFDPETYMPDSVAEQIDSIMLAEVKLNHIRLSPDSFGWHRERAALPKGASSYWAPGGPGHPGIDALALVKLPCFIVTDSAGEQLAREYTVDDAGSRIKELLKK